MVRRRVDRDKSWDVNWKSEIEHKAYDLLDSEQQLVHRVIRTLSLLIGNSFDEHQTAVSKSVKPNGELVDAAAYTNNLRALSALEDVRTALLALANGREHPIHRYVDAARKTVGGVKGSNLREATLRSLCAAYYVVFLQRGGRKIDAARHIENILKNTFGVTRIATAIQGYKRIGFGEQRDESFGDAVVHFSMLPVEFQDAAFLQTYALKAGFEFYLGAVGKLPQLS